MIEKLRFYIRHSLNDLQVNKQRTIFALLCIAAGVAAIVSLQTLGVMIKDTLTGSLQEANRGDIRMTVSTAMGQSDEDDEGGHGPGHGRRMISNDELIEQGKSEGVIADGGMFSQDYISVAGIDAIRTWFDENYPGTEITYRQIDNSFSSGISISAPDRETEKTFVFPYIIDAKAYPLYGERASENGKPLSDLLQSPNDIVLSRNLADDLGTEVGERIRLSGASEDLTLRGIVSTDTEAGFENIMGALFGYYYIDLSALNLFSDIKPGADWVYVKLADPTQVETVAEAFEEKFPYLETTTTADLEKQNSDISKYLTQMVTVMGLVSLLIGGIGIINTMLVIVSRRTTEIAVLKTIGLEGEQITVLFLVEAILMGIFGSLLGILLGWLAALVIKGVAEGFLAQSLTFRITWQPPLTGFLVGIITTGIFGFIPTLAAGQVRPNLVLRPSEAVVPKAGRARSFAALLFVMLAISLVAQPLINDLLDSDILRVTAQSIGGGLGLLMGLTLLASGVFADRVRGKIGLRILRWLLLIPGLPVLGSLFGYAVPALLILFSTFITVGLLYVLLWVLIWTVGGGTLSDIWAVKWKRIKTIRRQLARSPGWRSNVIVRRLADLGLIIVLIPVWALNAVVIVFMLPFWALGRLIQWLAFVDFKLALRSMLVTKGRGASTLLALVVGVFTLSLITMLATAIMQRFEELLQDEVGGNVIVFAAGAGDTLDQVKTTLDQVPGVASYAATGTFETKLVSATDVSANKTLTVKELKERVAEELEGSYWVDSLDWRMSGIDAREIDSNLPIVDFYAGRQLDERDTGPWDGKTSYPPIVISADEAVIATGMEVGDLLTFEIVDSSNTSDDADSQPKQTVTFTITGMVDRRGNNISINFGSQNYAPKRAFDDLGLQPAIVAAVVDVNKSNIRDLRHALNQTPGVFVMETRLLNDLINKVIDQFTSFPILVAALSLVVGGIVIANSVALATLERRREIAIMKAVGLQRERVLGMLLLEYGLMGLIGGLIGVGLGGIILLLLLVQAFGGELGRSIPYFTALQLMGLCVLIALVAAILTAWRASGEKPLNVLRYE